MEERELRDRALHATRDRRLRLGANDEVDFLPAFSSDGVGILLVPNRAAVAGFSSTFSFATSHRPAISPASLQHGGTLCGTARTTALDVTGERGVVCTTGFVDT